MESQKAGFASIDEYITSFPEAVKERLRDLRATINAAAPDATEKISYQMPTFFLNANLVYFGVSKNHIGFYPTPAAIEAFKDELSFYKGAKGSVQLPFDQPLPLELISRIVQFRVSENLKKSAKKK